MNWTLFKADLRTNWFLLLLIFLIMLLYGSISITMFDPESAEALMSMIEIMPEGVVKAIGFFDLGTDLTEYLASYLYGFIMIIFPLIYIIITNNTLMVRHIDRGSMAYLLATPNSRVVVAMTQAFYVLKALAFLCGVIMVIMIGMCESVFPGLLDIGSFILLNLVTYLVLAGMAGIGFLGACIFAEARWAISFGAGIPILFFFMDMVAAIDDKLSWLKNFNLITCMDARPVLAGDAIALRITIPLVLTIILYSAGVSIFNRRSLTI